MTQPTPGGFSLMRGLRAFDAAQQRSRWLAFPVAVFRKFFEDNGGQFAGLMAYYGFFSLFPLLLVLVTVLGLVLHGDVSLQHRIEDSSLAQFPIIGTQIRSSIKSLNGGVFPLAIGLAGAVWGGLAFTKATQIALDRVWAVPQEHRHSFLRSKLRGLMLLSVLGGVNVVTTALDGFVVAGGDLPQRIAALAASIILDFGLFVAVFVLMTSYPATIREVLPGAILATIAWEILQHAGGYLVAHQFKNLSSTYGLFALVLGTLAWLHIGAQSTLYAAELNVVRSRKLWPRSIF